MQIGLMRVPRVPELLVMARSQTVRHSIATWSFTHVTLSIEFYFLGNILWYILREKYFMERALKDLIASPSNALNW